MRYMDARIAEHDRREVYRVLLIEHMRAIDGAGDASGYLSAAYGGAPDFDAEETVSAVVESAGLEVLDELA